MRVSGHVADIHLFLGRRLDRVPSPCLSRAGSRLMARAPIMVVAALLAAAPLAADELADIVVEAQPSAPRVGDVVLSETTGSVTTLSGERLARAGVTLPRLLAGEAGLQVRESGGLGSYSTATLRGASSEQVMIYLDGLLLNDSAGGGVNLSNIDLLQVGAVDIYRGVTPVQLSHASLGGAINLRTREPGETPSLRWRLGGGSFSRREAALLADGRGGTWEGLASLGWRQSDNDFPYRNDNGTSFNAADDFDDHRHNSGVDQVSLLLKLGHEQGRSRQDGILQLFDKRQQIPDWKNSAFNTASLDTRIVRLQLNQRVSAIAGSAWNARYSINASRNTEEYDDRQSTIGLGAQHSRWHTDIAGAGAYWEHVGDHRSFALTMDYRHERYHAEDLLEIYADSRARRDELAVAAQESLFFLDDRLLIAPELRYRRADDRFDVVGVAFGSEAVDGRFRHDRLSPKVGVRYELSDEFSVAANIGSYQRLPSFFELFGDRGLFLGNEALKPETGINTDLLLSWRAQKRYGVVSAPSVNIGLFWRDVSDAIGRVYNARGIGKSINIDGALVRGIEWDLAATLGERLRLHFKATWQDAENRNRFPAFRGKQLPGQARLSTALFLEYPFYRGRLRYEFAGRFDAYYDTANLLPAEDQAVHSLGFDWSIGRARVSVELNNIGDDVHEDFNGFPKPGRSYFISVIYPGGSYQ